MEPESWVDEHGDALHRFAAMKVRSAELAEDLVQETFLAALRGAAAFDGRSSVRTWLIGILRRKIADHYRRPTPGPAGDGPPAAGGGSNRPRRRGEEIPAWEADPARLFEDAEFWKAYTCCLDGLPPHLAEVYHLREVTGLAPEEAARSLGISPGNVAQRLFRARAALRACLEKAWFLPGG